MSIIQELLKLFSPVKFINIELLIVGAFAHTILRLIPLFKSNRKINWKRWFKKSLIPNTLSTVVAFIILILISHVPELVEKFGKFGFKFVSFSLGFSGEYTAKQIERIIGWNTENQGTK